MQLKKKTYCRDNEFAFVTSGIPLLVDQIERGSTVGKLSWKSQTDPTNEFTWVMDEGFLHVYLFTILIFRLSRQRSGENLRCLVGKRNQELGSIIGYCNVTVTAFIFFN